MSQNKILPSEVGLEDHKFDTALLLSRLQFYIDQYPEKKHPDLKRYEIQGLPQPIIKKFKIGVEIIALVFDQIFLISSFKDSKRLQESLLFSYEYLQIQEEHLLQNASQVTCEKYLDDIKSVRFMKEKIPYSLQQVYEGMREMDLIVTAYRKVSRAGFKYINENLEWYQKASMLTSRVLNLTFHFSQNSIVIKLPTGTNWIITRDQLLMIHNKVHEMFNALFIGWTFSGTIWRSTFFRDQSTLVKFMIRKVRQLGNPAYTIFKNFDGIATGYIMTRDKTFRNSDPLNNVLEEMISTKYLKRSDISILNNVFNHSEHEALEMSAMAKLLGHPAIDTFAGIDKLRLRTLKRNEIKREEVSDLISSIKKNFIEQFLVEHHKWPPVTFKLHVSPTILYCHTMRYWITDSRIPKNKPPVTLRDFSQIEIEKIEEFDHIDSQFEILKDTALAEARSIVNSKTVHGIRDLNQRRTLVYFLTQNSPHTAVRQYFQAYGNKSPQALEYCVIKLTQKEGELKEEGRLFGQSPYVERARRCILEFNISRLMEKYNKHQAMTLTELQRFQKLYVLSNLPKKYKDCYSFYISIDVEAWNNNFRNEVVGPVGREIFDKMFGISKYYENIMNVFHDSSFIITDGVHDFKWEGQLGGIEGLAQKPWTWIYEAAASRIAELTGYNYHMMVNGDDIRIILLIPKNEINKEELKAHLQGIANDFEANYKKFGFNVKLQETYFSSELLGFGKVYTFDGHFCSQTIKKSLRITGLANLMGDYPLEYIKGVFSEGVSAMAYGCNHRFIYILMVIIAFRYLWDFNPRFQNMTLFQRLCIFLIPNNFGGLPVLPYLRCLYKGDSDLETCWWSIYTFIEKYNKVLGERLFHLATSLLKKTNDFNGIATNPYSLPNHSPPEGISRIKMFIRKRIPIVTKNIEFKQLIRQASEGKKKAFLRAVYSSNVIAAKPLSVMYETSAAGIIDEFINRFDTSKSIGALITNRFISKQSIRIFKRARHDDLKKIQYLIDLVTEPDKIPKTFLFNERIKYTNCPTAFSDYVRYWCYSKRVVGITYPCIVDQVTFYRKHEFPVNKPGAITYWKEAISSEIDPNYSHGKGKIFFGTHTRMKLHAPELELRQTSPGMRRINKILKTYCMFRNFGPQCLSYLDNNIEKITGLSAQLFKSILYYYSSGSFAHRVPANHWSPLVGPNEFSNRSSYIISTTRTDPSLKLKGGDYTINYSLLRAHVNMITMYSYEFFGRANPSPKETGWVTISDCNTCTYEITDEPMVWREKPPLLSFDLINNIYVSMSVPDKLNLKKKLIDYQQLKSLQVYQKLDRSDSLHIMMSQSLVARNFVYSQQDELRSHFLHNRVETPIDEDDLSTLLAISKNELANLSDLKSLPCEALWNAITDFMTHWYYTHYASEVGSGEITNLTLLESFKLPLLKICESIIETSYWPVLREYLETIFKHAGPPNRCTNAKTIQYFLNRLIIKQLTSLSDMDISLLHLNYTLPISQFPSDDELMMMITAGLCNILSKVIKNWLLTIDGKKFWKFCRSNDFDQIRGELNGLMSLKALRFVEDVPKDTLRIFTYNPLKNDVYFLETCMRLCGVNQVVIDKVLVYLADFEPAIETDTIIQQFQSITVTLLLLPINETTQLVRDTGSEEYKAYHSRLMSETVIKPDSNPEIPIISVNSKHSGLEIFPFQREYGVASDTISKNKIQSLDKKIQSIMESKQSLDPTLVLECCTPGSLLSINLAHLLRTNININKAGSGIAIVMNDGLGEMSLSILQHMTGITLLNFSYNYKSQRDFPELSYCDQLTLGESMRLSRTLLNVGIGDVSNPDHIEILKKSITEGSSAKASFIFLVITKLIGESCSAETLCNHLEMITTTCLTSTAIMIVYYEFPFSYPLFSMISGFSSLFESTSYVHPHYMNNQKPGIFLIFQYPRALRYTLMLITNTLYNKLHQVIVNIENILKLSKPIELFLTDVTFSEIVKLKKDKGLIQVNNFESVFQAILSNAGFLQIYTDFEIWMDKAKTHFESEIRHFKVLLARTRGMKKKSKEKEIASIQHTSRLLIEALIILFYISSIKSSLDIQSNIVRIYNYYIETLEELQEHNLYVELASDLEISDVVLGAEWVQIRLPHFSKMCLKYVVWSLLHFV
ncbi:RdRp [megalopteran chu-related virus 119]|uniref:RNA-directed RNA polymerase n=1 Tax=megalopteran chu-related virus 119 TaxID=2847847 RepID=A0A7U3S1R1_9VIRU|nr:RdRp [megalopteran chu-related virus 119]QPB73986.1 RdRp [megalopteran chu-related virus 119]